jgi:Amt family ammonium transporter
MVFTGTAILYAGWFGFNAGSAGAASDIAGLAFVNTVVATAGAILSWVGGEWGVRGKPSLLGACSGTIIAVWSRITPACGYVGVGGALIIGIDWRPRRPVGRNRAQALAARGRSV